MPLEPASVDQVLTVHVQRVEQVQRERHRQALPFHFEPAAQPPGGHLERVRPAVGLQGDQLAVEHGRPDGQGPGDLDHLGHAGGDVVQGAGEHPHLVAVLVELDPGAVQLPLDRSLPHPLHGRLDAGRGRGQHRLEGAADLEVELAQATDAGGQGGLGHRAEGPAQHHGPPHLGPGDPGGLGDGLDHHPLEGALAELAREQPDQEALLGGGRPPEQLAEQPPPLGLRPGPGQPADALEGGVDLGHGQGGLGRRAGGVAQRRPADPDLALAQVAGEERHRRVDLARLQAPQARRQPLHLGQAGGAGGDGGGRPGDLVEQHRAIVLECRGLWTTSRIQVPSSGSVPLRRPEHGGSG